MPISTQILNLVKVATIADLSALWKKLRAEFELNPALGGAFVDDPEHTLRGLGYELDAPVRDVLFAAMA